MQQTYTMNGGPKGLPVLGVFRKYKSDPLAFMKQCAMQYGDIIPYLLRGINVVQVNHPDLVRHVLMDNHKNYYKSKNYLRFESVLGKGLLTSNGDKWRRDRQKIQPMFKREQIEGYYFNVVNTVSEKYKHRWLSMTEKGAVEIDVLNEMSAITIEVILRVIFGDNLDEADIHALHHSYSLLIEYLKDPRLLPTVDLRKLFRTPSYFMFKRELASIEAVVARLSEKYRSEPSHDQYNMLVLLIEAQKKDPEHFTEKDIRDHSLSAVFAGYETTSIIMQWMWYALCKDPVITQKLYTDITQNALYTLQTDTSGITYDLVSKLEYLSAVFKEAMRLYPPIWVTSRTALEDDYFGDFKVARGWTVILPQMVMQRHPRWWSDPDVFAPERFLGENESKINTGLYFPFSQGARKCSGYRFAEMEACTVFAKLLPFFSIKALNVENNDFNPGITLKLEQPLRLKIERLNTAAQNSAVA